MTEETVLSTVPLPDTLPIFPLAGAVLLPRARLPLNIFEPRYLAMVDCALGNGRLIGMIQPAHKSDDPESDAVYHVGCVGRITSFSETEDGRFLISLLGVRRFKISEELPAQKGFRLVKPNWDVYAGDCMPEPDGTFDRQGLLEILKHYFKTLSITADWTAIQGTSDEMLIASLTMICPLEPNEKQALLEAPTLRTRADMLIALLEMSASTTGETDQVRH